MPCASDIGELMSSKAANFILGYCTTHQFTPHKINIL